MVKQAKKEYVGHGDESAENFWFRVVGRGQRRRVLKIKKTSLRFLSLNARSVMNKLDLLQATVLDLNPDVIGVTESWANENISDAELKLNGYELFRCDRKTGHRGGGILLYVKDILYINVKNLSV